LHSLRQPAGSTRVRNVARSARRLPLRFPLRITIPILLLTSGALFTLLSLLVSYHLVGQRVEQDITTDLHRNLAQLRPAVVRDLVAGDTRLAALPDVPMSR
jgi:hypothetical protein